MAAIRTSTQGASLADVLERILDKGVVIAGDIRIQLADVELLTIQIRLLIVSVDKAQEIGIDWWRNSPYLSSKAQAEERRTELDGLRMRIRELEGLQAQPVSAVRGPLHAPAGAVG